MVVADNPQRIAVAVVVAVVVVVVADTERFVVGDYSHGPCC